MTLLFSVATTTAAGSKTSVSAVYSKGRNVFCVSDYGAVAGDSKDDTAAFQKALSAAASSKGVVVVPQGNYVFKEGMLTVPAGVTLQGANDIGNPINGLPRLDIQVTRGSKDQAFLTLKEGASVKGLNFHYPIQSTETPMAYGWTIRLAGANTTVSNVFCKNAYQFLDGGSVAAPNHVVEHCNIWVYMTGIFIDKCSGNGLLKDVHIWPFDGSKSDWVNKNATGFLLGYAKNETIDGCFTIRYHIGFHFKNFGNGVGTYTLQTSGADCGPLGLLVDGVKSLKVTSGQFMHKAEISASNTGTVELIACNFRKWANESLTYQLKAQGTGKVTLESCIFSGWDSKDEGVAGVVADCSALTVTGCEFMDGKTSIELGGKVKMAVVDGNLMKGTAKIVNNSKGSVTLKDNLGY